MTEGAMMKINIPMKPIVVVSAKLYTCEEHCLSLRYHRFARRLFKLCIPLPICVNERSITGTPMTTNTVQNNRPQKVDGYTLPYPVSESSSSFTSYCRGAWGVACGGILGTDLSLRAVYWRILAHRRVLCGQVSREGVKKSVFLIWLHNACTTSQMMLVESLTRWRHQMETSSALLAICAGNSPVIGDAELSCFLWSAHE